MPHNRRIASARSALVIGLTGLIGLAGCQQLTSRPKPRPTSVLDASGPTPRITAAQEADAQIDLGRTAEQRGEFDQATAAYRAALTRDKTRADAYQRLAVLRDKQGKYRESAELYRTAIEVDPGNPVIFCDQGYSLYLQRRWAEAEMVLRQAIVCDPEHSRAHNNLGLVLAHGGQVDDAVAEFRRGGSSEAEAHDNVAFALSTEGRWIEARAQYRRALKAKPASQVAAARLQELDAVVAKLDARPGHPGPSTDPAVALTSATATASPHVAGLPGAIRPAARAVARTARTKPAQRPAASSPK
jgi:Tfp pilus assembly protein PilF